jgi:hypothetical protein
MRTGTTKRMLPKKAHISEFDIYELAAHMTGTTETYQEDGEEGPVEDALMEQYEVEIGTLTDIVRVLLPMAGLMKGGLTEKWYHCFSIMEADGRALSLVKTEIDPKDQCNYVLK